MTENVGKVTANVVELSTNKCEEGYKREVYDHTLSRVHINFNE